MLKLCDVKDPSQSVWLVSPGVTVGRDQGCDFSIADDSVAKLHLKIVVKGEQLTLGNTSGGSRVLVNGKPIEAACRLKLDDQITVGTRILKIIDPKVTKLKSAGAKNVAWALRANHRAIAGKVFPVKDSSVIGRSDECDIAFSLSHLSRRHARLEVREGLLFVVDLGSANGTYVNNRRITECRVRRGDDLRFDTLSFSVVGPTDDIDRTAVRPALPEMEIMKPVAMPSGGSEAVDVTQPSFVTPGGELQDIPISNETDRRPGIRFLGLILLSVASAAAYYWANTQGVI
ncbi:FHA domain-containing protein [Microbulbifer sp. MLAF003]|uniref:FHA domain-containing protein n=1 Tax=Microbulbifer sp. MLAF003 TaxID=3032582 RepID=UPI0024AE58AA|nr:FHA domain-containing protein [Microbulbifer sp. MLAF003]WHI53035.1 FHA domain-containing protein [Microbulbifer sp. MLAF003]